MGGARGKGRGEGGGVEEWREGGREDAKGGGGGIGRGARIRLTCVGVPAGLKRAEHTPGPTG